MTQDNAPLDPPDNVPPTTPPAKADGSSPPPKKKRRWIRRVLLVVLVLIVLLLILVGVTPMLLSTGAGRTFVLGKVSDNLNGKVTAASWSIGWTSGIHIEDLRVFDDNNSQILQIPRMSTQLSLLGAMRGQFHLGDTKIEGLDFNAIRDKNGVLNFAKLAKAHSGDEKKREADEKKEHSSPGEKTHLPEIDGDLQLVGCRGTFEDQNPAIDPKSRLIKFPSIAGDVNIKSINDPITDSLAIVANDSSDKNIASFSTSGSLLVASGNELLTPGKMQITQMVATKADLKAIQPILAMAGVNVSFTSGTIDETLNITNDSNGITVTPTIKGENIVYVSNGITANIGGIYVGGSVLLQSPAGGSATTNITFNKLNIMGLGGANVINGSIDDIEKARKFNNLTMDWTYNLGMLLDAAKPWLAPEQQAKLKEMTLVGNKTEHFTLGGSMPANVPTAQALKQLTATGEFALDTLEYKGAKLANLDLKFSLANGLLQLLDGAKTADGKGMQLATLNDGSMSINGATVDITDPHLLMMIPDGTKLLNAVALNPIFAQTFLAGWVSNPLMAGATQASGSLFVTVNHCVTFPLDALVLENSSENKGIMDMTMNMTHLEIGSKLVSQLQSALAMFNPKGRIASGGLVFDIPDMKVHIEHGITSEDMKIEIPHNPPMDLAGDVVMKTNALQMTLAIPLSKAQSVKLPVNGTVDNPKLDTSGLLKQNFNNIPGLKNLFGGDDKSATQPADKKNDPLKGILNGLEKKESK